MPLTLRPAVSTDAASLATLATAVWPDESFDPARIADTMIAPSHRTIVACDDTVSVGFVDCFATQAAGERRWEIDLLAVSPSYQGCGIGRQLIAAGLEAGSAMGIPHARALIALDNPASQRAFASRGFASDGVPRTLYVTEHVDARGKRLSDKWRRVWVVTFRYAGWWLEEIARSAPADGANPANDVAIGDLAGILVPPNATDVRDAAASAGFTRAGDYHYWEWHRTPLP